MRKAAAAQSAAALFCANVSAELIEPETPCTAGDSGRLPLTRRANRQTRCHPEVSEAKPRDLREAIRVCVAQSPPRPPPAPRSRTPRRAIAGQNQRRDFLNPSPALPRERASGAIQSLRTIIAFRAARVRARTDSCFSTHSPELTPSPAGPESVSLATTSDRASLLSFVLARTPQ
jgi:hypothetical protein